MITPNELRCLSSNLGHFDAHIITIDLLKMDLAKSKTLVWNNVSPVSNRRCLKVNLLRKRSRTVGVFPDSVDKPL